LARHNLFPFPAFSKDFDGVLSHSFALCDIFHQHYVIEAGRLAKSQLDPFTAATGFGQWLAETPPDLPAESGAQLQAG